MDYQVSYNNACINSNRRFMLFRIECPYCITSFLQSTCLLYNSGRYVVKFLFTFRWIMQCWPYYLGTTSVHEAFPLIVEAKKSVSEKSVYSCFLSDTLFKLSCSMNRNPNLPMLRWLENVLKAHCRRIDLDVLNLELSQQRQQNQRMFLKFLSWDRAECSNLDCISNPTVGKIQKDWRCLPSFLNDSTSRGFLAWGNIAN